MTSQVPKNGIRPNPVGDWPKIDPTAFVDPSAQIMGNVVIGPRVYVGPLSVIRADEVDEKGYQAVFTYPMETRIPLIQCPRLLLWGTKDVITFDLGGPVEKTNELIPRKDIVYLEGATFVAANTMPEKFVRPILDFLENPRV